MATENPRFSLTVPDALFQRIKDYQYENRMKNQTQAVLSLITRGLELEERSKGAEDKSLDLLVSRYQRMDESDRKSLETLSGLFLCQDKYKK